LVELEKIKRKEFMKHIDLNEFNEMRKNFEQMKTKKELESKKKIENMHKLWEERTKLLPLYSSPLNKKVTEENLKNKQEEQNKITKIIQLKTLQKSYSKCKIPKPVIKKIINLKSIENERTNPTIIKPYVIKSNSYSNVLRQNIMNKYKERHKNQSINENMTSGTSSDKNKNINTKTNQKNCKTIDYLRERRKLRELDQEKRKNIIGSTNWDCSGASDIKKLIKNNGINCNTLELAKCKLDSIDQKTKQKSFLLKCSGGVVKKPDLGDEVCGLMVDSIQAKLSLIQGIDKSLNDINENEELNDTNTNNQLNLEQSELQENTLENIEENE
jgi:hypothetical protein